MKPLVPILLLFFAASPPEQDERHRILWKQGDTYYVGMCNADGSPPTRWFKIDKVIVCDPEEPNGPNGPEEPNGPEPPVDVIAGQVDGWCDQVNDPINRDKFSDAWAEVIVEVETGELSIDDADRRIKIEHERIFADFNEQEKDAWRPVLRKINALMVDQQQRGEYSIGTLISIQKGFAL